MLVFRILNICLVVAAFSGCRPAKRYPNYEKWVAVLGFDRHELHGHPKQMTQYESPDGDTAIVHSKALLVRTRFRFNTGGDLQSMVVYHKDTLTIKLDCRYDENGVQENHQSLYSPRHRYTVSSSRLNDSAYKTVVKYKDGRAFTTIYTFPVNKNESILDRYEDTVTTGEPLMREHTYYNGRGRLLADVLNSKGSVITKVNYFYARSGSLDSIILAMDVGNVPNERMRQIFVNNEKGDPIQQIGINGSDTTNIDEYRYLYDEKGNWTRRLQTKIKGPAWDKRNIEPLGYYREFVY